MSKNYSGWNKGYLTKGEMIAYSRRIKERQTCQMLNCNGKSENMGYCLNHFPKMQSR